MIFEHYRELATEGEARERFDSALDAERLKALKSAQNGASKKVAATV